jgi:hypothetical protein
MNSLKKIAVASALVTSALSASAAPVSLVNADFETGTLSGWNTIGTVIATPTTTVTTFNGTTYTITAAGTAMAQLQSAGASVSAIEAALGVASGTLNALNTNPDGGNLTDGSALYQSFVGNAGDTLSMAWNYVATDYIPFNDPSFALLIGPSNTVQVLASIHGLGTAVGTSGNSGWQVFNSTLGASGNYTLAFVTTNDKDTVLNSFLHIDATVGSCTPNCPNPVPEPATLPLAALGLGLMGWIGRRKAIRSRKPN